MAKKIGCAVIRAVQGVIVAALALVLLANLYTLAAQRLFHNDSPAILGYRSARARRCGSCARRWARCVWC